MPEHRKRVETACTDSQAVRELNASQSADDVEFVDVVDTHDIEFVVGTDPHEPEHFDK